MSKYLIRIRQRGERSVALSERLTVTYADKWRQRGRLSESAGILKSKLWVRVLDDAQDGFGRAQRGEDLTFDKSRAAARQVIRRLRPQEQKVLDHLDAEIASTEAQLNELREDKDKALRDAWSRGAIIPLHELIAEADRSGAEHKAQLG